MIRVAAVFFLAPAALTAQTRFEWKAGEAHKFRVVHETTVSETAADKSTSVTKTKLTIAKTWTVAAVDAAGTATMSMTITSFKHELTRPVPSRDGKPVIESSIIDSSTPEGAQATADYLNKPVLTSKVDSRGRVSDVKATAGDAASRLQVELPFRVELPEAALAADSKWERPVTIKLEPPVGTGENFAAIQSFAVEKLGARTTLSLKTSLKEPPKDVAAMQPLLPWLWEGTITLEGGRYLGAKLAVQRDYPNHAGAGTKFAFASTYEETRE